MKRIFTLIAVALVATAMPAEAQKIKRANEAISRASELMQNARYEEADKIIDSLLAINPNYSDALYLRSNALLENDNYEEALDYCNRAIDHHTRKSRYDDSWLYYCRGNINSLMHDFDGAIADFNKAFELLRCNKLVDEINEKRYQIQNENEENFGGISFSPADKANAGNGNTYTHRECNTVNRLH
jgi:tetratricopeptide (TPR) repeat protein